MKSIKKDKNILNVPHLRFKEFSGEWEKVELNQVANKVTKKNKDVKINETFTNSAEYGVINQKDFFDKSISNADNIDNYYVVSPNDFVYNPRISNFAPVGPINKNNLGRCGIMSPLYTIFTVKNINATFLEYYFKSNHWHYYMYCNGDNGARHDRFSISDTLFLKMPIPITMSNEQQKIATFLTLIDKRIETQMKIIEEYKSLIKGIREKMFYNANELIEFNKIAIFENKTNHLSNAGLQFGKYLFFTNEENTYKYLNSFDFDGEFIIANTGGKANFKYYKGKFAVMTDCLVIQIKNKNETYYYFNVLKELQDKIDNIGFEGSGLKHLNKNWLFNLKVPKCININYTKVISLMEKGIQINIKILNNLTYCKNYMLNNLFI